MSSLSNKKLVLVSGLSGAGKSQVLNFLEDNDYFCIDNLPVELIPKFIDLCKHSKRNKFAVGIDVRSVENIKDLGRIFTVLSSVTKKKQFEIVKLYLEADKPTLIKRFSETRRKHPLGGDLLKAISREYNLFASIRKDFDVIIDTSKMTLTELKQAVLKSVESKPSTKIIITIMSFGYKYGIPLNADFVFDTRFLPNPNYVRELRSYTGKNKKVKDYVLNHKTTQQFLEHLVGLLKFILPYTVLEGKSYLTIAFGCTGGQHRSVVIAEYVYNILSVKNFSELNYEVILQHRDLKFYE